MIHYGHWLGAHDYEIGSLSFEVDAGDEYRFNSPPWYKGRIIDELVAHSRSKFVIVSWKVLLALAISYISF